VGLDLKSKILNNQKGTAIVEFAIILPLLIILIFGMVEFSVLFYDKAVITNASREGARAGIVYRADPTIEPPNNPYDPFDCTQIGNVVDTYLRQNLVGQKLLVTFGAYTPASTECRHGTGDPTADPPVLPPIGVCAASGDSLIITVRYNYTFLLLPNFLNFLPSPFTLTAVTNMRCE